MAVVTELFRSEDNGTLSFGDYTLAQKAKKGDKMCIRDRYWHLTELAAKCTAKRMVPDYISAKVMRELKNGEVYPCMGCRSFLTVEDSQRNADGSHKFYGCLLYTSRCV